MRKKESTGELIKTARKKAGLTQAELGIKLGVSPAAISQFEKPDANLKSQTIRKIAAALNVPASALVPPIRITSHEEIQRDREDFNTKFNEVERRLPSGYSLGGDDAEGYLWLNYPDGGNVSCDIDEVLEIINKASDYCTYELEKLRKK